MCLKMRQTGLISCRWLRSQLKSHHDSSNRIQVLDASWSAKRSMKDDYIKKHITGAQFLDQNKCVIPTQEIPLNLPERTCYTHYLRSLGVSMRKHLVVYDRGRMMSASRLWWILRAFGHKQVSVLDGGFRQWEKEGYEVESGEEPRPEMEGDFTISLNHDLIATYDDMVNIAEGTQQEQVVDVRNPPDFHGERLEPSKNTLAILRLAGLPAPSSMLRGHIPGAINLNDDHVVDPNSKLMLPPNTLKQVFNDFGVDLSKPMVTTCYGGVSACLVALAAHVAGKPDAKVYYGSHSEFGQRAQPHHLVTKLPNTDNR